MRGIFQIQSHDTRLLILNLNAGVVVLEFEGALFLVGSEMLFKVAFEGRPVGAGGAAVGALSCMNPNVPFEILALGEMFLAIRTNVNF